MSLRLFGWPLLAAVAVSLGAAIAALHGQSERPALLIVLAVVTLAPATLRILQRRWDIFEPIIPLSLGVFVVFVLSPAARLHYGEVLYRGFDVRPGFNGALAIGLVGTLAMYAGYASRLGRWARRWKPLAGTWRVETAMAFATGLMGVGVLLYAVFALKAGAIETGISYFTGRSSIDPILASGSSAYLYFGAYVSIPATLLLLETRARRHSLGLLIGVSVFGAIAILVTAPRGDRIWLLQLALGVVMLPYLRRGTRPRPMTTLVATLIGFLLVVFLVDVRYTAQRKQPVSEVLAQIVTHPADQPKTFLLSPDTEEMMVISLMYKRVPRLLPHKPGIVFTSLIASPFPRLLWSGKPDSPDLYVYRDLFPEQAAITKAGTSPMMFGGFYYDLGFPTLILYSFIAGVLARAIWEYLKRYPHNAGVRLFYATTYPLLLVLLRGNFTDTFGRALFLVGPILLGLWLFARTASSTAGSNRQSGPAGASTG